MYSFSEEKSDELRKAQQEQAMEPRMNGRNVPCEVNKGQALEESFVYELSNFSLTWPVTGETIALFQAGREKEI